MSIQNHKIAIIGGGAAGVFCAIQLAEMGLKNIQLYEKSEELLKKVRISGGGRCNVTHNYISNAQFSKNYPRGGSILKQNFSQFSPSDMVNWLESRGVKLKTESDGRMFPITDNSQTIIDCFEQELTKYKIKINFSSEVSKIDKAEDQFHLTINDRVEYFDSVVVATGGAQKERELDIFKQIKLETISPVPSLFTFKINSKSLTELMGISIPDVKVRIMQSDYSEIGPALITHWGLSGPAVLKLSAWGAFLLKSKQYQFQVSVNWMGDKNEHKVDQELIEIMSAHHNGKILNHKWEKFSQRFWQYLLTKSEIELDKKWSEISKKQKNKLLQTLTNDIYDVNGKTTFKEEFVTAGGIDMTAIMSSTMESKSISNLYFIGEVTNMDGITGGFNFQNAWTSAYVCAQSISTKTFSKS